MYQLSKRGKTFGIKWRTQDQAQEAKAKYIEEHVHEYAGLVQREFVDSGMTILEPEARDIAYIRLEHEVQIIVGG